MADRNYTLQLKSDVDLTDVYVANGNGYSTIGATDDADNKIVTLNTANRNLMQQVGHCVKYTTGMGFYNIRMVKSSYRRLRLGPQSFV